MTAATTDLETFRRETRAWLEANCPPKMRQPAQTEADVCWGGKRFKFQSDAQRQWLQRMAERGWTVPNWPREYGGGGLDHAQAAILRQEMAALKCRVPLQSFGIWMLGPALLKHGSEEQKRHYLPKMASGEIIGCFGLTEPDYGSNPSGMITHALVQKDGSWIINGAKMWITNGSTAQVAIIWAKTGDDKSDKSIRGFIVPTNAPGFTAKDQKGKLSLRASDTSELVLQDVRVPATALLPKTGGIKSPLMCLTQARYGISWGAMGASQACYEEALAYAGNRVMFGKPIAGFQLQQARLAEMLTELVKGQLLCLHLGRLKDAGTFTPQQVSLAKRNNVSVATNIAREARRLLGANGILAEYSSMRHMANLESVYTYEGTHDIHTLILGQAVTGINAFE
ncbi:MAG: acyl-CoA dehydrogenase family protein [Gemmatimonadaceae bacterium]